MAKKGKHNQDDHQDALRDRTRIVIHVASQEKESSETDLRDVEPDEDMVHGQWKEPTTSLVTGWDVVGEEKEIFVGEPIDRESQQREYGHDRCDDAVCESDGGQ